MKIPRLIIDADSFKNIGEILKVLKKVGPQIVWGIKDEAALLHHGAYDRAKAVRDAGFGYFADAKSYRMPKKTGEEVAGLVQAGASLITVTLGPPTVANSERLSQANRARGDAILLGISVLTAEAPQHASEPGGCVLEYSRTFYGRAFTSIPEMMAYQTAAALKSVKGGGVQGFVASPIDLKVMRRCQPALCDEHLVIVTTGVRLPGGEAHDQARVATPRDAAECGSDYVVVGREVTGANDKEEAIMRIVENMEGEA